MKSKLQLQTKFGQGVKKKKEKTAAQERLLAYKTKCTRRENRLMLDAQERIAKKSSHSLLNGSN